MKLNNKQQATGNRQQGSAGLWLLVVSLVVGVVMRFYKLGEIPTSLYWDETAIGYDAYALTQWGRDMHGNPGFQAIFPSYGDYKLPLYIWATSLSEQLFGPTSFAIRLPSAIAGIGIIIIIYLLVLELVGGSTAAGTAALAASILPQDILFSRTGFEGHLAAFFVGLTLYFWLASRRTTWLLFLSSITATAAVYSYFSARIVIPLAACVTLIAFFQQTTWRWKICAVAALGLWTFMLIPIYRSPFYPASNQFRLSTSNLSDVGPFALESNVLRQQSGNTFITRIVYHRRLLQAKAILANVVSHADFNYLFVSGDSNLRHSTGNVGVMFLGMLPAVCLGLFVLIRNRPMILLWIVGLWLAFVLPAAIPIEVPHALRSLNTVLLFPLLFGVGINYVLQKKKRWVALITGIMLVLELLLFGHDYTAHYPSRSATAWQSGYFSLASYLRQHESHFDTCTISFPDDRLYLYFLLDHTFSPQEVAASSNHFMTTAIGKYQFHAVEKLPTLPREWVAVDETTWITLHRPQAEIIRNASQQPLFYVIMEGKNETP